MIAALSERPCERTRQLLLELLERDAETRSDVIQALGQIGDARIVPKVIAIFNACTPVEQGHAIDVLAAIESRASSRSCRGSWATPTRAFASRR